MKEKNVKVLVRLADCQYDEDLIREAGIEVKVSFSQVVLISY
jgi:hypothetical protein